MNATQSTAAASSGVSAAVIVVASWALSRFGISLPPEVSAAAMVLVTPVLHFAAVRFGKPAA